MAQFCEDNGWDCYSFIDWRKQVNFSQRNKVVQRGGIGYYEHCFNELSVFLRPLAAAS